MTTTRLLGRPVPFAVLATIDLLAQTLFAVALAAIGWGALGVVLGFVVGSLVGLVCAAIYARSLVLTRPKLRIGTSLLLEGFPFVPAMIGVVIANYAVRFLLVQDGGQHDVGLFGVALRLASGIALVTGAFSMAWGPFGLALPDSEQTARLFGRVIRAVALMAVLVSVALGAAAPELITLVSGGAYRGAATMLPGLLIAAAMTGGFYVLLVAAGVSRRGHAVAYAAVAGAALQVALTAVLLPSTGLQAVGVGAVAGQALALVLLGLAVGRSVVRGTEAVVVMCAGGAAAIVIQELNAIPDATFGARLVIAGGCAIVAGLLGLRFVRRRFAGELG